MDVESTQDKNLSEDEADGKGLSWHLLVISVNFRSDLLLPSHVLDDEVRKTSQLQVNKHTRIHL